MASRAQYYAMSGGCNPYNWEVDQPHGLLPQLPPGDKHEFGDSKISRKRRAPIDQTFFEVRKNAVCVAGLNGEAVRDVKNQIASLLKVPIPLESFHVKSPSDTKDGALLVPKLVLVATHCAGRKLLDESGDEGQLDFLFDEACEMGCDIMLIYVGLPKAIYPASKHAIYHPKMEEMVFPTSPLLRHLASENCFFTVTATTKLSNMQRNVLSEWITNPVGTNHPVFETANQLSSVESEYESDFSASTTRTLDSATGSPVPATLSFSNEREVDFTAATEEHPLADRKKKRKKKEKKRFSFGRKRPEVEYRSFDNDPDLITLNDSPSEDRHTSFELDMYRESGVAEEGSSSIMF